MTGSSKLMAIQILFLMTVMPFIAGTYAAERLPIPGVKGSDNRTIVQSTNYPWSAIGRVNNTLGSFCTGTAVGPRQVLTAAHCLWNPRTQRWLPPCALHFLAGYQRGGYLKHVRIVSYHIASQYHPRQKSGSEKNAVADWAVLILAEDISAVTNTVSTVPPDSTALKDLDQSRSKIVQAGYSRDRPHILTMHNDCRLLKINKNGLIWHDCDATHGDSGSPILWRRKDRYHVIAIHVATARQGDYGIAVSASAFHDWLQQPIKPEPSGSNRDSCHVPWDNELDEYLLIGTVSFSVSRKNFHFPNEWSQINAN